MKYIAIPGFLLLILAAAALLWFVLAPPQHVAGVLTALERWRAGLKLKSLQIPGFRIAYLDGDRGEPLLLLHGSSGEKDNWIRVARPLSARFRVIALDLPGFGDSDRPQAGDYSLAAQVRHIEAFVTALGLTSFHLGGNSMGGRLAAMYAAAYPHRVQSLWLLAPGGVLTAPRSELFERLERGERNPLFVRSEKEFEAYVDILMTQPPTIPKPLRRALAARAAMRADLHQSIFDAIADEKLGLETVLARGLAMPARIVWGEADRVWHPAGAEILLRLIPQASLLSLPGIGHVPMIEAPQDVAQDYIAFVQSLPDSIRLAAE